MSCFDSIEKNGIKPIDLPKRINISSLHDYMVNIKLKYNFVETPRKFIIAELSVRKLGSSSVLIIMTLLLAQVKF